MHREIADLQQGNEASRALVHDLAIELERERISRRKCGEDVNGSLSQLREALDEERADRSQALHAIEQDMTSQLQRFKSSIQDQIDSDTNSSANLSLRFEHWFMDLQTAFDREIDAVGRKLEREVQTMVQNLEKESRDRVSSVDELTIADKAMCADLAREIAACKLEAEGLLGTERAERQALGEQLQKQVGLVQLQAGEQVAQLSLEIDRLRTKCTALQMQAGLVVDMPVRPRPEPLPVVKLQEDLIAPLSREAFGSRAKTYGNTFYST